MGEMIYVPGEFPVHQFPLDEIEDVDLLAQGTRIVGINNVSDLHMVFRAAGMQMLGQHNLGLTNEELEVALAGVNRVQKREQRLFQTEVIDGTYLGDVWAQTLIPYKPPSIRWDKKLEESSNRLTHITFGLVREVFIKEGEEYLGGYASLASLWLETPSNPKVKKDVGKLKEVDSLEQLTSKLNSHVRRRDSAGHLIGGTILHGSIDQDVG